MTLTSLTITAFSFLFTEFRPIRNTIQPDIRIWLGVWSCPFLMFRLGVVVCWHTFWRTPYLCCWYRVSVKKGVRNFQNKLQKRLLFPLWCFELHAMTLVQKPGVDLCYVDAMKQNLYVPSFSFDLVSVKRVQHIWQINSSHTFVVFSDNLGTLNVDVFACRLTYVEHM